VQVDPIKPTVKAPGSERLKLKCDELLSNFAFNINLHHYEKEKIGGAELQVWLDRVVPQAGTDTRPLLSSI
jgi:hypothetical protein